MNHSILIIGGGNMGGAIAHALHAAPEFSVQVVETDAVRRDAFSVVGIPSVATLAEAPQADTILLAIKPQQFAAYAQEMKTVLGGATPLVLSIMAGTPLAALHAISPRAVRVMPNLPAVMGESMSVLCAPALDESARKLAEKIFARIGAIAWVEDEAQLHAVTAISGSGPAYLFALMEALEAAAIRQGLSVELAHQLVTQTMRGSALLAAQSVELPVVLRAQVTSKGGTTQAALEVLMQEDFFALIARIVDAAAMRSKELADE